MSVYGVIDNSTRQLLSWGTVAPASVPPSQSIVVLADNAFDPSTPGTKTVNLDLTITVTPPTPVLTKNDSIIIPTVFQQTTNATPMQLASFPLNQPNTQYVAHFRLFAVDTGNGNRRYIEATVVATRLGAGALLDGTTVHVDTSNGATAAAWAAVTSASGNNILITITGQAGRTLQWFLEGNYRRFNPVGF